MDRRRRTRRESDATSVDNALSAYHDARYKDARDTAIAAGAILLVIIAVIIFV